VREFPVGRRQGLLLIGDWGAGKTHLAVAAMREMMRKTSMQGLYYNYTNLLYSIKQGYNEVSNLSDREAYRSALEAQILLLDDLGAHRAGDWVEDTVNSIIAHRCDHKLPLIATTNCPDADAEEGLAKRAATQPDGRERNNLLQNKKYNLVPSLAEMIGSRARSRLFEMCTIVSTGGVPDYRVQKKHKVGDLPVGNQ
jgi:DNA replication protein DnaC